MSNQFPLCVYLLVNFFVISLSIKVSEGFKLEKITISHYVSKVISFITSLNNMDTPKKSVNISAAGSTDIQFVLYNRMFPEGKLIEKPEELKNSNFNDDDSSKFIMHGWLSSGYKVTCQSIKDAYLKTSYANIFVVNWENIANSYLYVLILQKMAPVADYYAEFIKRFIEIKNIDPDKLHLIGHSLGAHISGMVGKRLQENGYTIGRITGLDPAFPGFHASGKLEKLSKSDAKFVDVIHTCGGTLGISESIGHVDFYPNGGVAPMPGCKKSLVNDKCSHSRSWEYFAESITYPFFATKCDTMESFQNGNCTNVMSEMGERTPKDTRGNFYLSTSCNYPYSLGIDGRFLLHVCVETDSIGNST